MEKLNSKKAAEYLGIPESTLRTWRKNKIPKLPFVQYRKGGRIYYATEELDKFIKKHKKKG